LESLAIEMYARGLSTRDIEALFVDALARSLRSRTAVSEITERLWAEYEAFATDLSEFEVVCLFVDGIAEDHLGQPREAVLAAWGILADGTKALRHLAPGTKEDTASCKAFFQDMRRRGLPDPLLVASDGAPGMIRAIEECFPRAHRRAIRSTNQLERLFGAARRRTKVIPQAFGERAVLKLMFAALIYAAEHWRGLKMTEFETRQLKAIRDELDHDFAARTAPGQRQGHRIPDPFIQQAQDLT
jgi:transposase-like protein